MIVKRIENSTRTFGAPPDWKDDGVSCVGLPVREVHTNQGVFQVSAWEPTPEELKLLLQGETVKLWIRGQGHPVVALSVGPIE